jgi:hypothetical protein
MGDNAQSFTDDDFYFQKKKMAMRLLCWLAAAGLLLTMGCIGREEPCPTAEEPWIALGFYRSGTVPNRWAAAPIDTSFLSVYALGTRAELSQRRIENFFMLPLPLAGGTVSYVFVQADRQDTITLQSSSKTVLLPHECGLLLKPDQVRLLPAGTSLRADSVVFGFYFPYDDPKYYSSSLAVFVP